MFLCDRLCPLCTAEQHCRLTCTSISSAMRFRFWDMIVTAFCVIVKGIPFFTNDFPVHRYFTRTHLMCMTGRICLSLSTVYTPSVYSYINSARHHLYKTLWDKSNSQVNTLRDFMWICFPLLRILQWTSVWPWYSFMDWYVCPIVG